MWPEGGGMPEEPIFSALRQFIYTASLVRESGGVTGAGTIAYYRCARSVKLLLLIN